MTRSYAHALAFLQLPGASATLLTLNICRLLFGNEAMLEYGSSINKKETTVIHLRPTLLSLLRGARKFPSSVSPSPA